MATKGAVSSKTYNAQSKSNRGIFGDGSNFEERYIPDKKRLEELIKACKTVGLKIVLTSGTFDFIHIGHFLYFEKAKSHGDILVVGVDSDKKVQERKGPDRPIVGETERVQMLTHVRNVDIVTIKRHDEPKWALIKLIRPDVLVATKSTYTKQQLDDLKKYCGEVVVLEPQATTSTTAKLRRLSIGMTNKIKSTVSEAVDRAFDEIKKNA